MESLLNEIMNTSISSDRDDFESMDEMLAFLELVMGRAPPIESVLDSVKRRAEEALMHRDDEIIEGKEEEKRKEVENNGMEVKRCKVEELKETKEEEEEIDEIIDISEDIEPMTLSSSDKSLNLILNKDENETKENHSDETKENHSDETKEDHSESSYDSSDSENELLVKTKPIESHSNRLDESESEMNELNSSDDFDDSDDSDDSDDQPLIKMESTAIQSNPIYPKVDQSSDSEPNGSDDEPIIKPQSAIIQSNPIISHKDDLKNESLVLNAIAPLSNIDESDSSEDEPILALSSSILPLSSSPSVSVPQIHAPSPHPPPPVSAAVSAAKSPHPSPIVLDDLSTTSSDSENLPIVLPSAKPSTSSSVPPNSSVSPSKPSIPPSAPLNTPMNLPKPSLAPVEASVDHSKASTAALETSVASSVTVSALSAAPKPVSRDITNSSISNSSLLIPVFRSTLESQQPVLPDYSGQPDYPAIKPPPLSREVINELFPRSEAQTAVERAIPKAVEKSSVVCPLCLALCEDAESLRRHINTACAMLPTPIQAIEPNIKVNDLSEPYQQRRQTPIQSPLRTKQTPIQSPLRTKQTPIQSPLNGHITPIQSPLRAALAPIRCPASVNHAMVSHSTAVQTVLPPAPHSPEAIKQVAKECSSISPATNSTINGSELGINLEDIDLFEKEFAANAETKPVSPPPPPVCSICRDSSHDESNPLLCCQSCKAFVHASCYGLSIPPSSLWKCDVSLLSSL